MQSVPDSQNAGSISHAQCPSGLRRRLFAAAAAVTLSGLTVFGPASAAAEAPLIGVVQLVIMKPSTIPCAASQTA